MRKLLWMLLLIVLVFPMTVQAQDWNSAASEGLTVVQASRLANTRTFNLTNQSNLAVNLRVLVWSLEIFNLEEPILVTMPVGWSWKDNIFQYVVDSPEKYYTPPALGPGESIVFTSTFATGANIINPEPSLGGELGFLCHVGAVVPDSGSADGTVRWIGTTSVEYGDTWHDRSIVPEPASALALGTGLVGLMGLCGFVLRRR